MLTVSKRSRRGTALGGPGTRTRQIILILVLIFVAYAVYTSPNRSADAVHAAWNVLTNAVSAIFRFFDALLKR